MIKLKSHPRVAFYYSVWWLGAESNRRHADFQSAALPTELPSHHFLMFAHRERPAL